jgi:outer membrane protein insertion porin family
VITLRRHSTFLVILLTVSALGQAHKSAPKPSPSEQKLVSVHVTGTQRFTSDEVIAASGLEIGSVVTQDDFDKAGKRLGESGFFSNVAYSYAHTPTGTRLDLQLVDAAKLVPAHFENFVWFSDDELRAKVREHLPLFKGEVPVGGTFCDQVSDVLQALLVQHNLAARADYMRDSKDNAGPIDAINFRATGLNLRIEEVLFSGASPEELPALEAAARNLVDKEYVRTEVQAYATKSLLPIYLERGFLKATIGDPQAKVLKDTDEDTLIQIQLPITPGHQYKVSSFQWEGNSAFKSEKLQSMIHAQLGQTINAEQLRTDLDAIQKFYGTRGYMLATVKPVPEFDDAANTVAYKLEVNEGDVFHLGDLDIQGLDAKTVDRLREAWTLREADPYDSTYPRRFFEQTVKLLSRDVTWTVSIHEGVNEKDKTVDVTLRYGLKPSS